MSNRGKRGASTGSANHPEESYYIEFNDNNQPCGDNTHAFMSEFNRLCDKHFQYYMNWKEIDKDVWEHVWTKIKHDWNIPDDGAKQVMKTKANVRHRKFRCLLHKNFVKKNKNPKPVYNIIDETKWSSFVSRCNSLEFQERSSKAKSSVEKNSNPSRLGRTSYAELETTAVADWSMLVLEYPWLSNIQDDRSKTYILGHCTKNKKTGIREIPQSMEEMCRQLVQKEQSMLADGTYHVLGRDPLTEVQGKEHGGRTKGISSSIGVRKTLNWVKAKRQRHDVVDMGALKEQIKNEVRAELWNEIRAEKEMRAQRAEIQDTCQTSSKQPKLAPRLQGISSPDFRGSSCASGGSYDAVDDIEEATECDLLWPYSDSDVQVASGMVYPTRDGIIHGSSMSQGYLKVEVDIVEKEFLKIPAPKPNGEVKLLEDAIHHFIQWPRNKVRIKHTMSPHRCISHSPRSPMQSKTQMNEFSSSSCYRPQMEEDPLASFQHQMPLGGYMRLLESRMPLDSQMDYEPTSLSPMDYVPTSLSPMVVKNKASDKEIKDRVAKLNQMPKKWKDFAKRFSLLKNKKTIRIVSPPDMYVEQWTEDVGYQDILDLHTNAHLSVAIIQWSSMCLYQRAESCGRNKCVFLNPNVTIMCTKTIDVVHYIRETKKTHPDKEIYVAPYCQSEQWLLFLVCPHLKRGYILDSSHYQEKSEKDYHLTPILERAFATRFDWMMVRCYQQKEEWESGYYLLKHMNELVLTKQADFPQNLWNDAHHLTDIYDIAFVTSSEFYKSMVNLLANGGPNDADDVPQ